ncbi:MAG TPA: tRNA (adenosine(37)-N6)-threonylcarbamoyltransferase complex ATPase subunit type 1 TsaE [Candidatus Wolfebacteria bacterium]|nr:tRNA (adenosine(37)-N6)-threonylcarbamoyltransferase complex ATPase subunit type 1 TsaE [Candidatus Wolfebacteria bacterium]
MPKLLFQISSSTNQTKKTAKFLVKKLIKKDSRKNALVLALIGDLGSGKTTFVQGFLRALGIKKRITSPTFVLIKNYKLRRKVGASNKTSGLKTINYKLAHHIDCYRIHKPTEMLKLGFKDIVGDSQNIVLIEWADKIRKILPRDVIWINFGYGDKANQRSINVKFKNQKLK